MWNFPKAVLAGLMSAIMFGILEVLLGEKFAAIIQLNREETQWTRS